VQTALHLALDLLLGDTQLIEQWKSHEISCCSSVQRDSMNPSLPTHLQLVLPDQQTGPLHSLDVVKVNQILSSFKLPVIPEEHGEILSRHSQKHPILLSTTIIKSLVTKIGVIVQQPSKELVSQLLQKLYGNDVNSKLSKLLEDHEPCAIEYQCHNLEALHTFDKDKSQNQVSLSLQFQFHAVSQHSS